ncbi:MAG: LysM peptidoglycan-binding domain-containing protein [Terrimesophilobacter sp.]
MTAIPAYIPRVGFAQPRNPRLRLTRRGRIVLTSLVAGPVIALVLSLALNGGTAAATSDLSSGAFDYVTVQAGQSLWALAETVAPTADPRDVVSEIVSLNQLENSELHPGDRIAIPIKYSR